jgi:hypothetical protein
MNHVIAARNARHRHNVVARYSNYASDVFQELPPTNDKTDLPDNYYSSGSSGFSWGNFFSDLFGIGNTFVSSYWNNGDKVVAQYNAEMLRKQERINTILWVVIGLVVALGVVLVIRKTK